MEQGILTDRLGRPIKHGMAGKPEYRAWQKMKDRCYNPHSQRYGRYGARGIRVCKRWRESFAPFYADMGPRPSPLHSIERIDNDGDYEPGNCRWATRAEQNRNRSNNVILEHEGQRRTLSEWAKLRGIGVKTLDYRIRSGWSVGDAIDRPIEPRSWQDNPSPVSWKRRQRRSRNAIRAAERAERSPWIDPDSLED